MFTKLAAFTILVFAGTVFAATNLNPTMSTQQIQTAINSAPQGSTVSFAPGTYLLTAPLLVPCANLVLTGPISTPASAVLKADNGVLIYPGNCTQLGSVTYLGIVSNGGAYFGIGNNSNFSFTHNQITGLQTAAGLFFDGNLGTTLSNVTVQYNTIGDQASCAAIFATVIDEGGYCAGVITSLGAINGLTVSNNTFSHVEEGIHLNQMSNWNPGGTGSVCVSCVIEYNAVLNYHRIGIEIQVGTPTNPVMVRHNVVIDPLNSSWGTFAVSLACCQWSNIMATVGTSPGLIFDDNVLVSSQPPGSQPPPYGVEFWGTGSIGSNSLVEGNFSNGYTWGFGEGNWAINNNYICGPNYPTQGGYISNQQGQSNTPTMTGNVTSATCQAKVSAAPTISPAAGAYTTPQTITLSDASPNTSIWYTLDGSQPVVGASKLYAAPFTLSASSTVRAVAMWGVVNQPVSYPAGYGYTPSGVVNATYTIGLQPPTCLSLTLNVQTGSGTGNMAGTFTSAATGCK